MNKIINGSFEVNVSKDIGTIYDAVSWFEKNALLKSKKEIGRRKLRKSFALQGYIKHP